jgi:phytoene/squalene synthetase
VEQTFKIVRDYEYNLYLAALYGGSVNREAIFSLCAFFAELGRVKHQVNEEVTGLIRLAWWREAIEEIYSKKRHRQHDVLSGIHSAIVDFKIEHGQLSRLISSFEKTLETVPYHTLEGFNQACADRYTTLFTLLADVSGIKVSPENLEIESLENLGQIYGIIDAILDAYPQYNKNRLSIPTELFGEGFLKDSDVNAADFQLRDVITPQMLGDACAEFSAVLAEKIHSAKRATVEEFPSPMFGPMFAKLLKICAYYSRTFNRKSFDFSKPASYPSRIKRVIKVIL